MSTPHPSTITPILQLERQGRYSRALRVIESLPTSEHDADLLAAKARLLDSTGRLVDALAVAELATDRWPDSPAVQAAHAACWYSHDRHTDALAAADRALSLEGTNVAALQTRALVLAEQGHASEAERCARQAMALDPDHVESPFALTVVLLKSNPSMALDEANTMVRRNRNSATLATRFYVRAELGEPLTGAADAREAASLDPDNELAALMALLAAVSEQDWNEAIRRATMPFLRENLTARLLAAVAYHRTNDHADAQRELLVIVDQQPGNLEMLALLREVQLELHAWDALVDTCTRLLAIDPNDELALITRARALCECGRPTSAIQDLDQILDRDPRNRPALTVRSIAYVLVDQPTRALTDANAAILAGAGSDTLAPQARLLAHLALGNRSEAEQTARWILRHDPDDDLARRVIESVKARRQRLVGAGATLVSIAIGILGG
jgi:tetratricopeptide (TPR) repeat protein